MAENKISVRNLVISFKTVSGKVQAVRDISFDLEKGETLAIVGESGSGKSVTAKAIIGILAGNAIVEGGEIIYDGKDLLMIKEDDFHKIRGNKISMVFQDPMSSLNPIVKIGRQLTEAMILKGKSKQRECKVEFKTKTNYVLETLDKYSQEDVENKKEIIEKFKTFENVHAKLDNKYLAARQNAKDFLLDAKDILFEIKEKSFTDSKHRLKSLYKEADGTINEFVASDEELITTNTKVIKDNLHNASKNKEYEVVVEAINKLVEYLEVVLAKPEPNLFSLAYYISFVKPEYDSSDINALNELTSASLAEFIPSLHKVFVEALHFYHKEKEAARQLVSNKLKEQRPIFENENLDLVAVKNAYNEIVPLQKNAINGLDLVKDSIEYTFTSALRTQIKKYNYGINNNAKEERRFEKENAKIDKIIAKGQVPTWVPNPPSVTNLELTRKNMLQIIDNLLAHNEQLSKEFESYDYNQLADDLIEFLKVSTAGIYNRVTPNMAKNEAIKIMKEVGIPEPRRRFYQYPFEFSGGMRQRIVIAIALVANPDVLICDEPTTALDVTIQAQILELIEKLKEERKLSIIFITHDLGVVANVADKVAVMYAGKIVEKGTADDIFYDPKHPYTWALLSSMPDLDTNEKLESIPGTPPNMIYPPKGDAFALRNKYAMKIDFEEQPPMFQVSETHCAATWLLHPDAPKVEMPKIVQERIARMKGRRNDGKQSR